MTKNNVIINRIPENTLLYHFEELLTEIKEKFIQTSKQMEVEGRIKILIEQAKGAVQ